MEDVIIVDTKDYAQVVFEEVKEFYSEKQTLECYFHLNELLKAKENDWIGIYKVGFSNYRDFVCMQAIDLEQIDGNKGRIIFDCKNTKKLYIFLKIP
jgi:hypothetical protein